MVHSGDMGLKQLLITSCVLLCCGVSVPGEVILDPPLGLTPEGELVVDAGSEFSLTCRGDSAISWFYNEYYPSPEDRSQVETQERTEHGQFISTLTVHNPHFLDTGHFYCFPSTSDRKSILAKSIYVYVRDPMNLLATNDTFQIIMGDQNKEVEFPCRPTDPSIEVILLKDEEELSGDIDVDYDPQKGFTFMANAIHFGGQYSCEATDPKTDNTQSLHIILHVEIKTEISEIEKPHITVTPTTVVEGMNVTFECCIHYDLGVTLSLTWLVPQGVQIVEHDTVITKEQTGAKVSKQMGCKSIVIYDITKQARGDYSCHVIDHSRNENENTYRLEVLKSKSSILELSLRGNNVNGARVIEVHPGQKNVKMVVDINALPPPKTTKWYDNNMAPIIGEQSSSPLYTVRTTPTESMLTILQPEVHYSGTYTLVVNNDAFNKSINFTLQVIGVPDLSVNEGKSEGFYLIGQEHKIDCDVFAFPPPNISWYFNPCESYPYCDPAAQPLLPSQYSEMEMNSLRGMLKSTVRVWVNCTGELTCKACNQVGCNSEKTTILASDVEGGFHIEKPALVVETDNVTLTCGVSRYNYTQDLKWLYTSKNKPPSPITDLNVWTEETAYSFIINVNIPNVTKEHSGNYTCSSEYRLGRNVTVRHGYFMTVESLQEPVIDKKHVFEKITERTGKTVKLFCKVRGTPPPTITWFKNGEQVMKRSNFDIQDNNQTLSINLGLEHEGSYSCVAVNKAGQDSVVFEIELTDKPNRLVVIFFMYVLPVVVVIAAIIALLYARRVYKLRKEIKELKEAGLHNFVEGNIESLNPDLDVGEQADLLPYNVKKWEFPRDKLKLGKQLGAGAFGMVLKAEAYELVEEGVATTVAVKMVKRNSDAATIKALASELKIMTHLGKHVNVVNVLGACTGDINKRELLVLVEYCHYGNLHNYLLKHRGAFINQVNSRTGEFDPTLIQPTTPGIVSARFSDAYGNTDGYPNSKMSMRTSAAFSNNTDTTMINSDMSPARADVSVETTPIGEDGYVISRDHEWRNKDRGDYKEGLRPVCTQDLFCWSFQIARGMEYLASRKVLHGDLAARNVLLAEENIVKICDFGFSKSIYRDDCYQKKGDGPLPVKWMALESIRDRVFSTQSDVWAYGVTLWEMFSLARTPYPGMEVDAKLFNKLEEGYRMEQPKYATRQVYNVMVDCWHVNPNTRPSFTELAERLGGMLEDTVRTHYVDLNDPFLQENTEFLAQQDYLSMLRSPTYANWSSPHDDYSVMRSVKDKEDDAMELTPMLNHKTDSDRTPDDSAEASPPIAKPIGNNYVNVAQVMGFSNPSYHNLGRPKQTPYANV